MTTVTAMVERPPKTHAELIDLFATLSKEYGGDLGLLVAGEIVELQETIAALEERIAKLEMKKR
jgi:hypothetical protein